MTTYSYNLRSRISSSSLSNKTPTHSPAHKSAKSPRKPISSTPSLQLKSVIGTTTSTPSGLSCCESTNSYAYCAGSVAVFAVISPGNVISYRYYKARPTAIPINKTISLYDSQSASSTPSRRRTTFNPSRSYDEYHASTLNRDRLEDGIGQTWSARERIKSVTCVSISPDGRILAVGETGYNPRVLLFSTSMNIPADTPLSIITDHTIGVRCVSFSAHSKYLATLGDVNDGFLYIWQVNSKTGLLKLHSSNKCTTNICDMSWCGDSVVTVGTRHIKIWQAVEADNKSPIRKARTRHDEEVLTPGPTPLQGRNCLLGPFVDATFTAVTAISQTQCVLCTDDGHICLLSLTGSKAQLSIIDQTENPIAAITYRQNPLKLIWAGSSGSPELHDLKFANSSHDLQQANCRHTNINRRKRLSQQSILRQSLGLSPPKRAKIVALSRLNRKAVSIDADGIIQVVEIDDDGLEVEVHRLSSHNGIVKGVQKLPEKLNIGCFLTWAGHGEIRFWNQSGEVLQSETVDLDNAMDIEDGAANELKIVRYMQTSKKLITGDQLGLIKVIDHESWTCSQTVRAHGAEISCINVNEPKSLMATCGRDRMVQIFHLQGDEIELFQTADDHIGVVNQVIFSDDGNRLLSCSADRTIVIRDRIERKDSLETKSAFISTRTVTLKAAPLSMSFIPDQQSSIVVSTMDRQVIKLEVSTGAITSSFKVSDPDSDDTVMLNCISLESSRGTDAGAVLAGYSAIDKSIRLYDLERGLLLSRDSGHTEGITDILMYRSEENAEQNASRTIVSTGVDGTIMIWSATAPTLSSYITQPKSCQDQSISADPNKTMVKLSPACLPPLRKILSRIDVAEFVRQDSPNREKSPLGLCRRTSRVALKPPAAGHDDIGLPTPFKQRSFRGTPEAGQRSPSPPVQTLFKPKKQRSRSEMHNDSEPRCPMVTQPEIPSGEPTSNLSASRHITRANNGRLRKPPSIPGNLRTMTLAQGRRQSVGSTSDSSSVGLATEQTCRMLKAYSKRLQASKGDVDLEEMEANLEAVLSIVRQKKPSTKVNNDILNRGVVQGDYEVNELSVLLERTNVS